MKDLNALRKEYPQYNDMSDQQFADAFHKKYYSDIPVEDFYGRVGLNRPATLEATGKPILHDTSGDIMTEQSMTVTDPRLNYGMPTNIPTIWNGQQLSDEEAIEQALGSGEKYKMFASIKEAEKAAQERSQKLSENYQKQLRGEKSEYMGPKRKATWKEFAGTMPFYGPAQTIPEDAELTPQQAELLGLSSGIDTAGFGIQQLAAKALGAKEWEAKTAAAHAALKAVTKQAREMQPGAFGRGEFAGDIASQLPFVPIGMAGKGIMALPAAGLESAAWGATQYQEPGQSKLAQMAIPAAANIAGRGVSEIVSPALLAAQKRFFGSKDLGGTSSKLFGVQPEEIAKDITHPKGVSPEYQKQMIDTAKKRVQAGKQVGVELTPAEAMGSPVVAKEQATLGHTAKGTGKLEEHWRGPGGRTEQENKAVADFFTDLNVSPNDVSPGAAREVRDAAADVIQEQMKNRKSLARPIYKRAGKEQISNDTSRKLLLDENLRDSVESVAKSPAFKEAAKKMEANSIDRWHLVKKNMDDKINAAYRAGDTNKARLLQDSQRKLLSQLDKASPKYKAARKIFSSESEVLAELNSSNLGKIANLDDKQLSLISKTLFDPQEIDPKTLNIVRNKLLKQNPKAYNEALANNIKNKMDTLRNTKTNRELPAFMQVVSQDKNYNMYMDALKHNPKAQKRLTAMRTAFQDLSGDFTPKTAASMEKSGVLDKRSWMKTVANWVTSGGKYDEAAIKFITDPKWIDKADMIARMPDGFKKSKAAAEMLSKIANAKAVETMRKKK